MSGRILHLLSQRPSRTGSGVTLDSLVRLAGRSGWRQQAVVGVPVSEIQPALGDLDSSAIHPVFFTSSFGSGSAADRQPDLDFPVPGMSDVMPYCSSVWSTLSAEQLDDYRSVWRDHLQEVVAAFKPDLIHTNHIWLLSSLIKQIAPDIPTVASCHATGLRQMELCPGLKDEVVAGCRRIDQFCVLRRDHRDQLAASLDISLDRITVTGAGYRQELFFPGDGMEAQDGQLLYIGKYSEAKGLPWLLDAVERLAAVHPGLRLHVAGSGAGAEAEALLVRMEKMAPLVVLHGQIEQPALADLMRQCAVCVLPSFYEGVPLVLVEAAACGCRIVSTALTGVIEQIQPHLDGRIELVSLPRLAGTDRPVPEDLPVFVEELAGTLDRAMSQSSLAPPDLGHFTWEAVFGRVEKIWQELI